MGYSTKNSLGMSNVGVSLSMLAEEVQLLMRILVDALSQNGGHLGGAALDVIEPKLPEDHAVYTMSNVIITPHLANSGETKQWHAMLLRENIRRFLKGDALFNVVDPELGY